jgi:hemolysin III
VSDFPERSNQPEEPDSAPAPLRRSPAERMDAARQAASERAASARQATSDRAASARQATSDRASAARVAATERMDAARQAAGEQMETARAATAERVETARAAAVELGERVKPKLRGVFHQWAFVASLIAGAVLVWIASTGEGRLAAGIYALSLSALLGTSAVYHRVDWKRPSSRRWMRRLDHSMIFFLIAGTITPFALLVMEGPFATALLIAVWAAAIAGAIVELIWVDAPKWVSVIVYLAVGWVGALGFPSIAIEAGVGAGVLIAVGGILYTAGAVVYARQRPDPNPVVFGYHEIFHVLVVAAAAAHFAAIAIYAVPTA